jgi:chemotaxis protein MotA
MLLFVGAAIVLLSVLGGYMWEEGKLLALSQPAEFLIIGGAAIGTMLVSTPVLVLKDILAQLKRLLSPAPTKDDYGKLLAMLYELFRLVQQTGVMALEAHVENPADSTVLRKYPSFLGRHHAVHFLADSVKVMIVGGISPYDLELLMNEDLDIQHKEAVQPSATLAKTGDALPGLGIVAAVLGVVNTMGAIDGPASELGKKVGGALVGTLIGILLSYGFVQPLAQSLEQRVHDESNYNQAIKAGLLAVSKGLAPALAIEFARRIIPEEVRPTFEETEALCRATRGDAQAAAAAAAAA